MSAGDEQAWERWFIAGVLGLIGAVTGMVSVWMLTDLPGVAVGSWAYWLAALVGGGACMVAGFSRSDATVDTLGEVWQAVWRVWGGIHSVIRQLYRLR